MTARARQVLSREVVMLRGILNNEAEMQFTKERTIAFI